MRILVLLHNTINVSIQQSEYQFVMIFFPSIEGVATFLLEYEIGMECVASERIQYYHRSDSTTSTLSQER